MMKENKAHFELNGSIYQTDEETLNVLRSIVPAAHETGDASAVIAVIALGELTGRVRKIEVH